MVSETTVCTLWRNQCPEGMPVQRSRGKKELNAWEVVVRIQTGRGGHSCPYRLWIRILSLKSGQWTDSSADFR